MVQLLRPLKALVLKLEQGFAGIFVPQGDVLAPQPLRVDAPMPVSRFSHVLPLLHCCRRDVSTGRLYALLPPGRLYGRQNCGLQGKNFMQHLR